MKKLLLTSFEPFGGDDENASDAAVRQIPCTLGEFEIHKLTLPVSFGRAAKIAIAEAEAVGADVVLSVGQAAGRDAVTPEAVAINLRYAAAPDNDGACPHDTPIEAGGREAYFSTLPVRHMAEAISASNIPAAVSYSAGTYVCNDVFYSLSARFFGTPVRVGFIHVPSVGTLGTAASAEALRLAIISLST